MSESMRDDALIEPTARPTTRGSAAVDWLTRPIVFAPMLLLLAAWVSLWYASRGLPFQDEGATLTAAAKLLRGGVFYRDIDAYPFPGAPYLLTLWMALLGEHLSVARALAGAAYCGVLLALYASSLQLFDRVRAALFGLSLLGFKFLAWPAFSAYMYSDLSFCFACIAIALLLTRSDERGSRRLVLAGACVAFSLASKQNLGIYLGAASGILLLSAALLPTMPSRGFWVRWAPMAYFALGVFVPILGMAGYFAAQGVLGQALYSGLVRPFTAKRKRNTTL